MEKISVKTGKKRYLVVDEYDKKLGVVEIDPADTGILKRTEDAQVNIQEALNELSSLSDDIGKKEMADKLTSIDTRIREELNALFNYDVSSVVFKKTHCISTSNGVTFVERFLDAITPIIEKEFDKEFEASSKRIRKYTEKYHK